MTLRIVFLFFLIPGILAGPAFCKSEPKEGILLAAFGTSVPEARKAFDTIEKIYRAEFPGVPIVWAFTSQIIRKKLARDGVHVGGISDGLAALARDGVRIVRVQSLHVMAGEEFAALARSVLVSIQKYPDRFEAVYLGRPLLESARDAEDAAQCALAAVSGSRKPGEAVIFMGHGHEHGRADLVFEGARAIFRKKDPLAFLATVEGSRGFNNLAGELEQARVKQAVLAPLMVVAGDHARNDLAGADEDSWAGRLDRLGIKTNAHLAGLGENPCIVKIFARHTRESADNICREPVKP